MPKKITPKAEVNKKEALTELLKTKLPAVFDREPTSGYNSNLEALVEEILAL